MSDFPTNPALAAAIVANAGEDTPRLAYADWLDENGDADRAEFIRVQCRLAELTPAAPDRIDLEERQRELVSRLTHRPRFSGLGGGRTAFGIERPERFYAGLSITDGHWEPFRRGFPYHIACQTKGEEWTADEVARVADELTKLVRTTTVRGFETYSSAIEPLTKLLAAPVIGELTTLGVYPDARPSDDDRWAKIGRFFRALGTNPLLRRVRHLDLSPFEYDTAVEPLAAAETFDSVERFRGAWPWAEPGQVAKFVAAPWVQRLRHFDTSLERAAGSAMAAGLGRLPHLHTLEVTDVGFGAAAALAAGAFPALERLVYSQSLDRERARALASAKFPKLVAFEVDRGGTDNAAFDELLQAEWFGRLRVLQLNNCKLGDRALKALAAHTVAKTLRVLNLCDGALGPEGLMALARGAFPALTTLNLWFTEKRRGTPVGLTRFFEALDAPNLRHLDMNGWQLGDAGAKALAKNPSLARLRRLSLERCRIGDPGAKALIASPRLQNLVGLFLGANPIRRGADALTDPTVMPRLGELWLPYQSLARKTAEALERRPGLYLLL